MTNKPAGVTRDELIYSLRAEAFTINACEKVVRDYPFPEYEARVAEARERIKLAGDRIEAMIRKWVKENPSDGPEA